MKAREITTKEKWITPYTVLLVSFFSYHTLLNFIPSVVQMVGVPSMIARMIPVGIIVALLLYQLFLSGKTPKLYTTELVILLGLFLVLCVSYLLFPNTRVFYSSHNMRNVFFKALPFFIIGVTFQGDTATLKALTYASYVAVIVNVLYLFYFTASNDVIEDNMHWAYLLLPHILIVINSIFKKEIKILAIFKILVAMIGLMYLLSAGSRGPILISLVYLAILVFRNGFAVNKKYAILAWVTILTVVLLIATGTHFAMIATLQNFIEKLGFSTRAFELFFQGEYLSYTSGRDRIFELLWQKILEKPILGYGVFGEWEFVGYSAHNLWLQFCMHYGLLIGTGLLFAILWLIVKAYRGTKNEVIKDFILIYFVFTVVRGIFGGDYFSDYFFFLFGLSLHTILSQKKHNVRKIIKGGDTKNESIFSLDS